MLDSDLAELYGVETKHLKRQVNRNIDRFPEDFMFVLTEIEHENLRRQFGTSSWGGLRYLPMVFNECGILMLSSVLNSKQAISVNIEIMRIFAKIRQASIDNTELRLAIEEIWQKTENNTKNIEIVFSYFDDLLNENEKVKPRKAIGYTTPDKRAL
ncbi:ORF6N domain-containing protein [Aurantibacillus circumpalustris]|uniref:ORF6N domain-containing protein n=1 Tax=Aurantibacillus circumpalustris TaxID=3036359 RepID=UPI0037BED7B5